MKPVKFHPERKSGNRISQRGDRRSICHRFSNKRDACAARQAFSAEVELDTLVAMRMRPRILSVSYVAQVHSGQKRFSIPKEVLGLLKMRDRGIALLSVRRASSGEVIFFGEHQIKSGVEIYGPEVASLMSNETIWVEISKAQK